MSDDNHKDSTSAPEIENSETDPASEQNEQRKTQSGPTFTQGPDPLASVKESASNVLDSMEGKTVSMKTYVGTIIGIVVLMLLARCGG